MNTPNESPPTGGLEQAAVEMAQTAVETARENGEHSAAIEFLRDQIFLLTSSVESLKQQVAQYEAAFLIIHERLDALADDVEDAIDDIEEVEETTEAISEDVQDVSDAVEAVVEDAPQNTQPTERKGRNFISLNPFKRG